MQTVPRPPVTPPHRSADALGRALLAGLHVPLDALRASLESLAGELPAEHPRADLLAGALAQVTKVARAVEDLADYATQPRPRPLRCTVDEILNAARQGLSDADRERVLVARGERGRTLVVDGPLLAGALRRLIENALEASSGYVLVNVRAEGDAMLFCTVNRDPHPSLDPDWAETPFQSDKPQHLGLGLALAKRDVELMGGSLRLSRTPRGETVAVAVLPTSGGAAR